MNLFSPRTPTDQLKFRDEYRVDTARLKEYDYSSDGTYFVTICTKDKRHFFGEVISGEMKLSIIGDVAKKYWLEIPGHFAFAMLDEFVIMPNHMHGILIVNRESAVSNIGGFANAGAKFEPCRDALQGVSRGVSTINGGATPKTPRLGVSTINGGATPKTPRLGVSTSALEANIQTNQSKKNYNWKSGSLGVIINQYKRICSIEIKKNTNIFAWQSRFYDHVIRNENELKCIREYIFNNALNWEYEKNNAENLYM